MHLLSNVWRAGLCNLGLFCAQCVMGSHCSTMRLHSRVWDFVRWVSVAPRDPPAVGPDLTEPRWVREAVSREVKSCPWGSPSPWELRIPLGSPSTGGGGGSLAPQCGPASRRGSASLSGWPSSGVCLWTGCRHATRSLECLGVSAVCAELPASRAQP